MSNIDKQWLQQKIADMEAARDEIPFGPDQYDSNMLAALRIALASLEADKGSEPVAKVDTVGVCWYADNGVPRKPAVGTELFSAPPAPVSVPDEVSWEDVPEEITEDDMALALAWAHGFNQCRAAMLQGADGNYPVIPERWENCKHLLPIGELIHRLQEQTGDKWISVRNAISGDLISAMEEVLRISDRDHDAWHRARAAIAKCRQQ